MSSTVIRVENLSKRYVIKHASGRASGDGLRHAISDAVTAPFRKLLNGKASAFSGSQDLSTPARSTTEDFYALREVSFEVKQGEVLGIIGRNGAGKSTLLKILSRITEPSSGRIGIKGRVASLLEVGTGFHPELNGRENVYLNGAILGMTRDEVRRKFDEIVDFAGVERFLDTPVKHYSSGMYVRLAFAVAAHLQSEILIVDEVLAVGDLTFQKKCLGKMEDVSRGGRTVLFVSHNVGTIKQLCKSGVYLVDGHVHSVGAVKEIVDSYSNCQSGDKVTRSARRQGNRKMIFSGYQMVDQQNVLRDTFEIGEHFTLLLTINALEEVHAAEISIEIKSAMNETVAHINNIDGNLRFGTIAAGDRLELRVSIGPLYPNIGTYSVILWAGNYPEVYETINDALTFDVISSPLVRRVPFAHVKMFIPSSWELSIADFTKQQSSLVQ